MTFEDLKRALFVRSNFGMKLGLERMREALRLLGDPHLRVPVLHVAGTNGKGSTCAFAEAGLRAAGLRTGLYTSPHLVHFCERMRIGGTPIPEERACELFEAIAGQVPWALDSDGLTFFEIATLMGFLAFAEADVDVAVVEVGLGGRLDATNVVQPVACAISSLGLEHLQYLGPTIADVAAEKGGILKAPAATAAQPPEAMRVLAGAAHRAGVPLWQPGREYAYEHRPFRYRGPAWDVRPLALALVGPHQRENAALACALLELAGSAGVRVGPRHAATGLAEARWPARLEVMARDPLVLLDGAHNPHAAAALARALPEVLEGRPLHLVFASLQDKDAAAMLRELGPLARTVHFCAPDTPRALPPVALQRAWPGRVHETPWGALEAARADAGRGGAVLCTGSLYLVGALRARLLGRARERMPTEKL